MSKPDRPRKHGPSKRDDPRENFERAMNRKRERFERAMAIRELRNMPFGGGPGFGPPRPGGGRGRKRRGDVRAALLHALAEEPRNGYQLMQLIEERSGGRWRPSPGSVYPALAQLEDEGLIRSIERDETKLFEITDAGREHLEQRGHGTPPWEAEDEPVSESFEELMSLTRQIHLAAVQVAQAGDEGQRARASQTLAETRRALYRILAEDPPADAEAPSADDEDDAADTDE
jgi:DNA-binding PadR family transcriptional regulator